MTSEWVETSTALKFRLGELTLFSVRLPCLALTTHFTHLGSDPLQPRPPFERLASGIEAAVIRSHPIKAALPRLSLLPEAIRYVPAQYLRYYTNLDGTFDAYLKGFSSKSRSTLQRKIRKFAEVSGGRVSWRQFTLAGEMQEFHGLARAVSRNTYQERLLHAGLPDDPGFVRTSQEKAAAGTARGYILFLGPKPVAYLFCPIVERVLLYEYVGYDPEYQHLSPGTVLQYLVLERIMTEGGFTMFDFTEGEGQHKEFFSTHSVRCADLYYFRPTMRNRLLLSLHAYTDALSDGAVALLHRLGLKTRIKKLLRAA